MEECKGGAASCLVLMTISVPTLLHCAAWPPHVPLWQDPVLWLPPPTFQRVEPAGRAQALGLQSWTAVRPKSRAASVGPRCRATQSYESPICAWQSSRDRTTAQWVWKVGLLSAPWWAEFQAREHYSQALVLLAFALQFELTWGLFPLSSFPFFPFGMGMSIPCPSHHCILEAQTYLVSQIKSWGGIVPQNESYLESHPYLIEMMFR